MAGTVRVPAMRLFQVDAFAERPFGGNPAAVCLVEGPVDADWMQSVATEMNLSETAFLVREGDGLYGLRWFTPAIEVDLCGHATLASAHVLWDEKIEDPEPLELLDEERRPHRRARRRRADPDGLSGGSAGRLVQRTGRSRTGWRRRSARRSSACTAAASTCWSKWRTPRSVRRLAPDFRSLAGFDARGVIVTAAGDGLDGADFVSRCFYPASGVDEDPVTGSAHCTLASFWCTRLGPPVAGRLAGLTPGRPGRRGTVRRPGPADRPGRHRAAGRTFFLSSCHNPPPCLVEYIDANFDAGRRR